jgi:predicted  nucleic acid-binding Zn-ribbon protein
MSNPLQVLLDLQSRDTILDQHRHRRANLPERAQLVAGERDLAAVDADIERVAAGRDALAREQKRIEDDAAAVEAKARSEDQRLYSGTVTAPKELQSIQEEIDALHRRQSSLEDDVLELMVQIEPLDAELDALARRRAGVAGDVQALRDRIQNVEREIDAAIDETATERAAIAGTIPSEILSEYETLRPRLGGIAAAKLEAGSCRGCHLQLSAVELDRIKKLPPDAVVHCEECGRILVR